MSSKVTELQTATQVNNSPTRGTLFVVSSPSGGGKGTLIRRVLDVVDNLSYSVSYTTRGPRANEVNGREYFFIDLATFDEMIAGGEFLEWACVHGNFYGLQATDCGEDGVGVDMILKSTYRAPRVCGSY